MSNEIATKADNDNSLLSPKNFEHHYRIASMMAKSDMVPKAYKDKPQDILLAMEYGRSLGLVPLAAVQNIAVINGRPAIYGDGILAVCSGHPDFEDISEEQILGENNQAIGYRCTVKRKGRTPVTQVFTLIEAKQAGLLGKSGSWSQYPTRMLQMRSRAFALRDCFADALGGVRVIEEVQDYREIKDVTPKERIETVKDELLDLIESDNDKP